MGDSIRVESAGPNEGSTFILELPAVDELPAPRPPAPASRGERRPRGTRVLVVDDNEDAADVLCVALAAVGYDVEAAHDGPSAIEVARRFHPDIALLDIGLPVMDGYELAQHLRALGGDHVPRLVAITGYGLRGDRERSERAGFEHHLVKPVDLTRLQDVIESPARTAR